MQTQIRHCIMRCLIRIFTVCLHIVLLKFRKHEKYYPTPPNTENGLVLLISIGKSIQIKRVKQWIITVCLQNVLLKFGEKNEMVPPKTGNGLVLLIIWYFLVSYRYHETNNNCYDFVILFLHNLGVGRLYPCLADRLEFCKELILPRTHKAGQYISMYRDIQSYGYICQKVNMT